MLSWLQRTFTSSVGRKVLLGLSGLGLIGFLIGHLAGNLTLYADDTGETFNSYAHAIESNPLLPFVEIALLGLFAFHIGLAIKLQMENRSARGSRYVARGDHGQKTPASSSMLFTGIATLLFLVIHLSDFRLSKEDGGDLAAMVKDVLSDPLHASAYIAFMLLLTMHLAHGFQSACQSLGAAHPRYSEILRKVSIGLALLLGLGFLSFPVILLMTGGDAS